jgi:probable HAF family extracellular repeat protein
MLVVAAIYAMVSSTVSAQTFNPLDYNLGEFLMWGRLADANERYAWAGGLQGTTVYKFPVEVKYQPDPKTFEAINLINNATIDLATPAGGATIVPVSPPENAVGEGLNISRDGSTIVGYVDNGPSTPFHAFRWTESTGIVDLGTLDPPNNATKSSFAYDVSTDGSVVIGYSGSLVGYNHVFRWTQSTGMVDLDAVNPESHQSQGYAASEDGNVIVGQRDFRAFRWTQGGGFQQLGPTAYFANSVNGDGSVIVGQTTSNIAFRWTEAGGVQSLGVLPGDLSSMATAVSDDGNIVIGISSTGFLGRSSTANNIFYDADSSRAFYWTAADGMQDLTQLLADAGVNMTGNVIAAAKGMTPDGKWMHGAAITPTTPADETTAVLISLTESLPDADFTENDIVDKSDLANWRTGFGTASGATHMQGDADGDGDADGRDFLIWQRQRGSVSMAAESSFAVPEPVGTILAVWALAGVAATYRRRPR